MTVPPFTPIAQIVNELVAAYQAGEIESVVVVYKPKSEAAETVLHDMDQRMRDIGMLEVAKQMLVIERMEGV